VFGVDGKVNGVGESGDCCCGDIGWTTGELHASNNKNRKSKIEERKKEKRTQRRMLLPSVLLDESDDAGAVVLQIT
jgi:hypothetical protein